MTHVSASLPRPLKRTRTSARWRRGGRSRRRRTRLGPRGDRVPIRRPTPCAGVSRNGFVRPPPLGLIGRAGSGASPRGIRTSCVVPPPLAVARRCLRHADVANDKRGSPIIAKSALLPPKSPGPQEWPGTLWNVPGTLQEYFCGPYLLTDQSDRTDQSARILFISTPTHTRVHTLASRSNFSNDVTHRS